MVRRLLFPTLTDLFFIFTFTLAFLGAQPGGKVWCTMATPACTFAPAIIF